jgi:hypothetical protein
MPCESHIQECGRRSTQLLPDGVVGIYLVMRSFHGGGYYYTVTSSTRKEA